MHVGGRHQGSERLRRPVEKLLRRGESATGVAAQRDQERDVSVEVSQLTTERPSGGVDREPAQQCRLARTGFTPNQDAAGCREGTLHPDGAVLALRLAGTPRGQLVRVSTRVALADRQAHVRDAQRRPRPVVSGVHPEQLDVVQGLTDETQVPRAERLIRPGALRSRQRRCRQPVEDLGKLLRKAGDPTEQFGARPGRERSQVHDQPDVVGAALLEDEAVEPRRRLAETSTFRRVRQIGT